MLPKDLQFKFNDYFDGAGKTLPGMALSIEGHAHTDFTDGLSSAEECVEHAMAFGLDTIVFTEHVRRGAPWFDKYVLEIERLKKEYRGRLRIVCGIEARALDDHRTLDADEPMLLCAEIVVGSVHGLPAHDNTIEEIFHKPGDSETLEREWELLQGLIKNTAVHIIGHPFGTYYEKFGRPPAGRVHSLLRAASAAGKAVEINIRHMDVPWFLACAAAANQNFLFWPGSDAHLARHVGKIVQALKGSENIAEPDSG